MIVGPDRNALPPWRPNGLFTAALVTAAVTLAAPAAGRAQSADPGNPEAGTLAEIRAEIAALKQEYGARLAALEARLAALEAAQGELPVPTEGEDELATLRAAAREAAGVEAAPEIDVPQPPAPAVTGRERNLNRLNPEISFTGIFVGQASDADREEFRTEEFELDLQSALDPFSRTRWTIAFGEEGVEIEEGYVVYSSLPGGLELAAGKFRQQFGPLNRQHLHALPQTDYPLVYQAIFGEEGLAQTGVSLTWLPSKPWATANEVVLQVTDGENEEAFGGESFEDLAVLARLKSYWDLTSAAYFEWGLSGIAGQTAEGGDSQVFGTDFTYQWRPPRRAKYREVTWRTELLVSRRDDGLGIRRDAWGAYTYLEGLLARNLYAGVRLDRVEVPLEPERVLWGLSPYVTFWQSEFVRLRAEYSLLRDDLTDEEANRFSLQLTWAAGPHKHETY